MKYDFGDELRGPDRKPFRIGVWTEFLLLVLAGVSIGALAARWAPEDLMHLMF